jgi:hypothetical protein
MKNVIIQTIGQAAEQHYRSFHLALGGILGAAMRGVAPTAPSSRAQAIAQIQQAQTSTLTALADLFDTGMRDVAGHAIDAAHPGLDSQEILQLIDADLTDSRNAALATVAMAMHRDSMVVSKRIRDFSLRVDLLSNSTRQNYQAAVTSAAIAESSRPLAFTQVDTAGRRWQPSVFAAAAIKSALQTSYADTFVRCAGAAGDTSVAINYPDPAHTDHGALLSISGDDDASYSSRRDALFHPNSTAALARTE